MKVTVGWRSGSFKTLYFSLQAPENPVVSPVSGQIFERRLIEKYLAENGCDPTNQVYTILMCFLKEASIVNSKISNVLLGVKRVFIALYVTGLVEIWPIIIKNFKV